ncbi:Vacuolar protein sorting/targeting protein 10 [Abortiporus biennis]
MTLSHGIVYILWVSSLILSLLCSVSAQEHTITYFNYLGGRLFFFDNHTSMVYHDPLESNIYVSQDEGMSWKLADGIPLGIAASVFEHPFDNSYAFVLTEGTTHYRTDDRGKTWRAFDMPIPPAFGASPLSFHSDPKKYGYILYQGTACEPFRPSGYFCRDETYYTKDAFASEVQLLLSETCRCQFAHSSGEFMHNAHPDLIYCIAFNTSSSNFPRSAYSERLFSSTDFFEDDIRLEELGIGKDPYWVVAFAIISKFAVVTVHDLSPVSMGDMFYVSVDTKTWAKAQFPHASPPKLHDNSYTIVKSTTHSLAVHVMLEFPSTIGTLFISNSNGTYFAESLLNPVRNEMGFAYYENLHGIDGVGLANIATNVEEVVAHHTTKQLQSRITFDDGHTWSRIRPPAEDSEGGRISCNPSDDSCSLHLHSVSLPYNFGRIFSSPAPGFVIGVGSISNHLLPYKECDTFLSTDNGVSWKMVRMDANQYKFGDFGSILVGVDDREPTDEIHYSTNLGKSWNTHKLDVKVRTHVLTSVPDSTSQKFVLFGQVGREDMEEYAPYVVIFLDFSKTRKRKCGKDDFERWWARSATNEQCLMGHKQWYNRRKIDVDCYVGGKSLDPVEHEENCPCTDEDYECDYNYIKQENKCVPAGPEPIPPSVCEDPTKTYKVSSGWRKIPGNTCDRDRGVKKDEPVEKPCSTAQASEGQNFEFPAVPYSSYEGGVCIDRGTAHICFGFKGHSFFWWFLVLTIPTLFAFIVGYWFYRCSRMTPGTIRLPGSDTPCYSSYDSDDVLRKLAAD